jgi:hypothetical protein
VDEFIFLDDVQFTTRDWRTRNRIKTANGPIWLSVPAGHDRNRRICDVLLPSSDWQEKHWKSIVHSYSKAPFFARYRPWFEELYLGTRWGSLSEMNQTVTTRIARDLLAITTHMVDSREYAADGASTDRLLDLIVRAGGDSYLSGPRAKAYLDSTLFEKAGIQLRFKDYSAYPAYPQLYPPFEHAVSILDLIFNTGPAAPDYIWGLHGSKP